MIETARLVLRPWRPQDRAPFAALNGDAETMAHFPAPLTADESDQLADRIEAMFADAGFGPWAVEVKDGPAFIGFVGLARLPDNLPMAPGVEIAWRLSRSAWGRGYASEAARACLAQGFALLGLEEIVSFTAQGNHRSRAVMERIGMVRDAEGDFDHPNLPPGHRLSRHVLYRSARTLTRDA